MCWWIDVALSGCLERFEKDSEEMKSAELPIMEVSKARNSSGNRDAILGGQRSPVC